MQMESGRLVFSGDPPPRSGLGAPLQATSLLWGPRGSHSLTRLPPQVSTGGPAPCTSACVHLPAGAAASTAVRATSCSLRTWWVSGEQYPQVLGQQSQPCVSQGSQGQPEPPEVKRGDL